MNRHLTTFLAALTALALLGGCSARTAPAEPSMSLMERYHSGLDLVNESGDETDATRAARAHLLRGMNYQDLGRTELAFEQFSRAAALDPDLAEARYRRGLTLRERGMSGEALADFAAVMQSNPEYAPAHEAAGLVYFDNALFPEAEEHLARALELDPTLVQARVRLGVIRNYRGDHQGALEAFREALALAPNDGGIHNNIGMTLSMAGDDEGAVEAFRTALRLGAPSTRAYNNMGLALARLGRMREALEAFRCAGGEAAAYNNLGYLYFLNEEYGRAVAAFERAIELEPRFYVRADENLKRARMALRFATGGDPSPAAAAARIPELDEPVGAALPAGPLSRAGGVPGPALAPARQQSLARTPGPLPFEPSAAAAPEAAIRPASAVRAVRTAIPAAASSSALPASVQAQASSDAAEPPFAVDRTRALPSGRVAGRFDPGPLPDYPVYTLHQSSWHSLARAQQVAGRLRSRGLEAYVLHVRLPEKGDWYRVTIGMYPDLKDARSALDGLQGGEGMEDLRVVRRQRFSHPES